MPPAKLILSASAIAILMVAGFTQGTMAHGDDEHSPAKMLDEMREEHAHHEHEHGFETMEGISEEDMHETMDQMVDIGLVLPKMNAERGGQVFLNKGCVLCHSVNGVGGDIGPSFDSADMPKPMNTFEFAARMWRGAPAMVQMQEELLGDLIALDGQELADLVAFAHDSQAQAEISADDIPEKFRALIP